MISVSELVRAAAEAAWNEATLANDCPNCSNEPAVNPYRKRQCPRVAGVDYGQELRCRFAAGHEGECKP